MVSLFWDGVCEGATKVPVFFAMNNIIIYERLLSNEKNYINLVSGRGAYVGRFVILPVDTVTTTGDRLTLLRQPYVMQSVMFTINAAISHFLVPLS